MQIGEAINLSIDLPAKCPFNHSNEKIKELQNDLEGVGATLAKQMVSNTPTDKAQKPKAGAKAGPLLPQKDPKHVLYRKKGTKKAGRVAQVSLPKTDGTFKTYGYPVSCAAHHLIPSQESLKDDLLLKYMVKKGGGQAHNHQFAQGKLLSDVGYDTNGCDNGIHLPGNYAVGAGRGGCKVWDPSGEAENGDDDLEFETYINDGIVERDGLAVLSGQASDIQPNNPCWAYIYQAMKLTGGQFHDRHEPFSKEVIKALKDLYKLYTKYDVTIDPRNSDCAQCKQQAKKLKDDGLPPPPGIVAQLNNISGKAAQHLGNIYGGKAKAARNIFTSKWVDSFFKEVIKKGNDVDALNKLIPVIKNSD